MRNIYGVPSATIDSITWSKAIVTRWDTLRMRQWIFGKDEAGSMDTSKGGVAEFATKREALTFINNCFDMFEGSDAMTITYRRVLTEEPLQRQGRSQKKPSRSPGNAPSATGSSSTKLTALSTTQSQGFGRA